MAHEAPISEDDLRRALTEAAVVFTLHAYQHVLDKAQEETWFNQRIRVASVEGLILLKLLAYRLQDQIDIDNLVAAHKGSFDLDWIRAEWQSLGPLDDPRMQRLMQLAS